MYSMCVCTTRRVFIPAYDRFSCTISKPYLLFNWNVTKNDCKLCAQYVPTHRHTRPYTRLTHPYAHILLLLSFTKTNAPGPCTSIRRYFVRLTTSTITHRYLSPAIIVLCKCGVSVCLHLFCLYTFQFDKHAPLNMVSSIQVVSLDALHWKINYEYMQCK